MASLCLISNTGERPFASTLNTFEAAASTQITTPIRTVSEVFYTTLT